MDTQSFTHPLIVVDQNKLRSLEAIHAALDRCCRENLRLLIPDGAFFEMSKSQNAFDTWRRSLKELAPYRELVVVSSKMTQLIQAELGEGCSCSELTNADGTAFARRLLAEIHQGNLTTLTAIVEGPLQQQLPASAAVWTDFATHKANIQRMRDLLKPDIQNGFLKRLRQSPHEAIAQWLSSADGVRFVFQGLQHKGASETTAIRLSSQPSVNASFLAAMAALALYWLAVGGLESASSEKVTNDLHDIEYAVLGSLCRDLLTRDQRLACIHTAVKAAVGGRALWFARTCAAGR